MRQMITAGQPGPGEQYGPVRGGWIWGAAGVVTVLALAVPVTFAILRAGNTDGGPLMAQSAVPTRTVIITQPVTALSVESYGAPIRVIGRPVSQVTVTEAITFNQGMGRPPHVTDGVSRGLLTLAAPACQPQQGNNCSVAFTVTVPTGVTVSAMGDGGPVSVSGVAATTIDSGGAPVSADDISGQLTVSSDSGDVTVSRAASASLDSGGGAVSVNGIAGKLTVQAESGEVNVNGAGATDIDSGGGPVTAASITGPLRVSTESGGITVTGAPSASLDSGGGPVTVTSVHGPLSVQAESGEVQVDDVTGALSVDTGGGPLSAASLTSPTATVNSEGANAVLGFLEPPTTVQVQTGGGMATLSVPGGPYALSADSGGGPKSVAIVTSAGAARTINVSTDGGAIQIGPA